MLGRSATSPGAARALCRHLRTPEPPTPLPPGVLTRTTLCVGLPASARPFGDLWCPPRTVTLPFGQPRSHALRSGRSPAPTASFHREAARCTGGAPWAFSLTSPDPAQTSLTSLVPRFSSRNLDASPRPIPGPSPEERPRSPRTPGPSLPPLWRAGSPLPGRGSEEAGAPEAQYFYQPRRHCSGNHVVRESEQPSSQGNPPGAGGQAPGRGLGGRAGARTGLIVLWFMSLLQRTSDVLKTQRETWMEEQM